MFMIYSMSFGLAAQYEVSAKVSDDGSYNDFGDEGTDTTNDGYGNVMHYNNNDGNSFAVVMNGNSVVIDGVAMPTHMSVQENASVVLSDGNISQISVSPKTALTVTATKLNTECYSNCEIELLEMRHNRETTAAYRVTTEKEYKLFGLFKRNAQVSVAVDAETGDVISTDKPWWAFLSMESKENVE